jgi:hypothetical protein
MGQRPDRHQHARARRRNEKGLPATKGEKSESRAPLAGYETLYEITRSGRVYSLETQAFVVGAYHHSKFVRITENGAVVSLPKQKAVADSWRAHRDRAAAGAAAQGAR